MRAMGEEERLRIARGCFGCGDLNSRGLKLAFRLEDGAAVAELDPDPHYQGFPGHMHGGLVATMLDEAMGWAAYLEGVWAMTARMHVRFRRSVPLGRRLQVRAYITNRRQRLIQARAEVRDENGALLAEGEGAFLRVTPEEGRKFEEIFRARAGTPGSPV